MPPGVCSPANEHADEGRAEHLSPLGQQFFLLGRGPAGNHQDQVVGVVVAVDQQVECLQTAAGEQGLPGRPTGMSAKDRRSFSMRRI